MSRPRTTIRRGTVQVKSRRQHRYLHAAKLDHTHVSATGRRSRHTFTPAERARRRRRGRR